jgi:DNA polymerase-3 subunit beta
VLATCSSSARGVATQLTTSDLEIQIRVTAELGGDDAPFATTVGARKLIDILRTLPADQKDHAGVGQWAPVAQGRQEPFYPADAAGRRTFRWYRSHPTYGPAFSVPQKVLKALLEQVSFAMAVQDIRYYLNGILFVAEGRQLTLVATDGHRLALTSAELDVTCRRGRRSSLPRKTVLELQRLLSDQDGAIEMRFAATRAKFAFGGLEFVTKLVEGKFPDYNRVIPRAHRNVVVLGRAPLLASLQRAAIMTSDKFKGVRLHLEPGCCRWRPTTPSRKRR